MTITTASRLPPLPAAALLASLLAACNQTTVPTASAPPPGAGVTPVGFALPAASGCAGEVARFRAVMDNDLATGHVAPAVHARVVARIDAAGAKCGAGQDGAARAEIAATRRAFGYPG